MTTGLINTNKLGDILRMLLALALGMCLYVLVSGLFAAELALGQSLRLWLLYCLLPWALMLPLLLFLLPRCAAPRSLRMRMSFAIGALLALVLLHAGLIVVILSVIGPASAASWRDAARLLTQSDMLLFDVLVFIVLAGGLSMRSMRRQMQQKDADTYRLSRSLSDTKMQSLMMQLNPHFLFNTLNGLAVLIDKRENEAARDMLGELSGFLRRILRSKGEKWVTLEDELEFIRQYLRIEQYRFGKRLVCFEDCEPLTLSARIPPLLLQPLFENAIVHGLADKQGECRLGFECRLYDRHLLLTIFDNGENFDAMQDALGKGGIGLSNVQARLREVYGDNCSLNIEKKTDGTLVTLKLPAYKDSQF